MVTGQLRPIEILYNTNEKYQDRVVLEFVPNWLGRLVRRRSRKIRMIGRGPSWSEGMAGVSKTNTDLQAIAFKAWYSGQKSLRLLQSGATKQNHSPIRFIVKAGDAVLNDILPYACLFDKCVEKGCKTSNCKHKT